ncbi:MAG: NAD-dependent epimerase/dehydratase family protein [Solirubrobacteraceae bacterium]
MGNRAIVTGGAGFIGSHLVDALLADGLDVAVIDDLSSGAPSNVPPGAHLHELDITDLAALDAVFEQLQPSSVFHLAAQASVVASVQDPRRDCDVNVRGTLNVLEAAGRSGAPVIFTSTGGALYGDAAPRPTSEDCIPQPLSPYGASKWAAESYVRTWALSSGIPHVVCRLGNVYGPRQSPHGEAGVVAIFTGRLHERRAPVLYGHGKPTRDYIYVSDVVAALRTAAAKARPGVFNIGTSVETDVETIWRVLSEAAGVELEAEYADLRPGELQNSCLDTTRAEAELEWSAEVPIEQGLRRSFQALSAEMARA